MTEERLDGDMLDGDVITPETGEDRLQVGLTEEGRRRVKVLTEDLGWFSKDRDAGRFALAYAIREGATPDDPGTVRTAWHLSTLDPSGEIQALLAALHPGTTTPVRLIQGYVDAGLRLIEERISAGETNPATFLG